MILTIIGFIVLCLAGLYVTAAALSLWAVSTAFGTAGPALALSGIAAALWSLLWWLSPFSITVVTP